jgi:hypothetical protein
MNIYSPITLCVSIVALGATALLVVRLVRPVPQPSGLGGIVLILDREFRAPAFLRSENFVLHELAEDYRDGISGLSAEAHGHVCRVGRFYGDAGTVAATSSFDARLPAASSEPLGAPFLAALHWRAEAVWAVLEPYVEVERRRRGNTWWKHFENLATHRERTQATKPSTPLTTAPKRRAGKRSGA